MLVLINGFGFGMNLAVDKLTKLSKSQGQIRKVRTVILVCLIGSE